MLLPGVTDPGCARSGRCTTGAGAETTDRPGGPLLDVTLGRSVMKRSHENTCSGKSIKHKLALDIYILNSLCYMFY